MIKTRIAYELNKKHLEGMVIANKSKIKTEERSFSAQLPEKDDFEFDM